MSIRATSYALDVADEAGPVGARFVLLALAARANGACGCVFGGDWLHDASGLHRGSVRRHLDALEAAGLIAMRRRSGRAHVVRFPVAAFVHNPAHQCAGCKAWNERSPRAEVRDTPRTAARDPAHHCAPNLDMNLDVNHAANTRERHPAFDPRTVLDDGIRRGRAERVAAGGGGT